MKRIALVWDSKRNPPKAALWVNEYDAALYVERPVYPTPHPEPVDPVYPIHHPEPVDPIYPIPPPPTAHQLSS